MKIYSLLLGAVASCFILSSTVLAQEQEPGKPLYLPGDKYKEHPADLAPNSDPHWKEYEQGRQKKIQAGKRVENPYDEPADSVYEKNTRYEIVKDRNKSSPPKRWGN